MQFADVRDWYAFLIGHSEHAPCGPFSVHLRHGYVLITLKHLCTLLSIACLDLEVQLKW